MTTAAGVSVPAERRGGMAAAGFFLLRTPALPFDRLAGWGANLQDREILEGRLREIVGDPLVREAVFLASPGLEDDIAVWLQSPRSGRGRKIERALVRYFLRMTGRCTPFGLFAGWSTGTVGTGFDLTVAPRGRWIRRARPDFDYLCAIAAFLLERPESRRSVRYRPNDSLYAVGGALRWTRASRKPDGAAAYELSSTERNATLQFVLERAKDGALLHELSEAVAGVESVAAGDAAAYVERLVDAQLLVAEFGPFLTGKDPLGAFIASMQELPAGDVLPALERFARKLAELAGPADARGALTYRQMAAQLEECAVRPELSRLFQVDVVKPAPAAELPAHVVEEVARGIEVLRRLAGPPGDPLKQFREAFQDRYGTRQVPLLEVLDEEAGIGFAGQRQAAPVQAPLLDGIELPRSRTAQRRSPASGLAGPTLRRILDGLARGATEVDITPEDGTEPAGPALPPLFAALVSIAAESAEAVMQGRFRVHLRALSSGARLFGRFCHADPVLEARVRAALRSEEGQAPDAVFAELVHLPQGRLGNVSCRPVLRDYEIVYRARSGADPARQLQLDDLLVSVEAGKVVLHSRRLGKEVRPKLGNAHNYALDTLPVYHFLCALETQEGTVPALEPGWLDEATFLPRIVSGRVVLAPARWLLREDAQRLAALPERGLFAAVQDLRARLRMPRFVAFREGEQELPLDLDNPLCVDVLGQMARSRDEMRLVELLPSPAELCATGEEGRFVHELVIPFLRAGAPRPPERHPRRIGTAPRSFAPGSEWLYVKLYAGDASLDVLLAEAVKPVADAALASGAAGKWFFLRYDDPSRHLRVRFEGEPARLLGEVLPALRERALSGSSAVRPWKVQLDTYEREIERYGGPSAIATVESIFHADSAAAAELCALTADDAGTHARWRLTLLGMQLLLEDFGFDLPVQSAFFKRARTAWSRDLFDAEALHRALGDRYRSLRSGIESLLAGDPPPALAAGFGILARRSEVVRPLVSALRRIEDAGSCTRPLEEIAGDLLHMHVNRMLPSASREQEVVLYDFLERHARSALARRGASASAGTAADHG